MADKPSGSIYHNFLISNDAVIILFGLVVLSMLSKFKVDDQRVCEDKNERKAS